METIWILVQPIGKDRLYPRGYCYDVGDAMWKACDGSGSFGPLGAPGDMVKVTAIVIHDGSEEDAYLYAAGHDGFAIGDLPSPPVSISNTVTVRLS